MYKDGKWAKQPMIKCFFPFSDDWRKKENRIADFTALIERLLALLHQ